MEILRYETYVSNSLLETPLDQETFRKYRSIAYVLIEMATDLDLSKFNPPNSDFSTKINLAITYQIDFTSGDDLIANLESNTNNTNISIGKVSVGASSNSNNRDLSSKISPLVWGILNSLGLLNRSINIKDCIY